MGRARYGVLAMGVAGLLALSRAAWADAPACARPAAGSVVAPPAELFSAQGVLDLALDYRTSADDQGRTLYCFVTPQGSLAPTLHVRPGDLLRIKLTNELPADHAASGMAGMAMRRADVHDCTVSVMSASSVNLHFHGINARPACHQDEVLTTFVNPGESYQYAVRIPADEPPGLYWYHPHVHGLAANALLGGASGALVVDGIEAFAPEVAHLPVRTLVIRDQHVAGNPAPQGQVPSYDVSVNYVPVDYPALTPAVLEARPGQREFWRVVNASADLIADLQLTYDGVHQMLAVVARDGVPVRAPHGPTTGGTLDARDILLPPGARAEFIMTTPPDGVQHAVLETLKIHGGPSSDNNIDRVLAVIKPAGPSASQPSASGLQALIQTAGAPWPQRFADLDTAQVTAQRHLYFYEINARADGRRPNVAKDSGNFYITVAGRIPVPFDPYGPPSITTRQGAVEDWVIQNRTLEVHEFHMHQIHFQLRERNGTAVPERERQLLDTVQVPYWTGRGPYPSVTLRMDFRGDIVGDFVYHCHILDHEDLGMMEKIRVLPRAAHP